MSSESFDVFTGAAQKDASDKTRAYLDALQSSLTNASGTAYDQAGDLLKSGFTGARGDLAGGYDAANAAINTGATGALNYLDAGTAAALERYGMARGDLGAAGAAFAPLGELAGKFGRGADLYADATGVNGAEGRARATDAFSAGPGYQYALDQGIDAINRRANAAGCSPPAMPTATPSATPPTWRTRTTSNGCRTCRPTTISRSARRRAQPAAMRMSGKRWPRSARARRDWSKSIPKRKNPNANMEMVFRMDEIHSPLSDRLV